MQLLLVTRDAVLAEQVSARLTSELACQVVQAASPDEAFAMILADAYAGVVIDLPISSDQVVGFLNNVADSGSSLSVWVTESCNSGMANAIQVELAQAVRAQVHILDKQDATWLDSLVAYWKPVPPSKWDGLTFDDMPGYQRLKDRYLTKLPQTLAGLQDAWASKNWTLLHQRAHAIKGGAGSFGLADLTEMAAGLDQAARREDESDAATWLARIQTEFGGPSDGGPT